jgi:DNA-binding response OmpR family regulator
MSTYQQKQAIRFREFELDHSAADEKSNCRISPCRILRLLMEQPGEIVTREDLRKQVWPSDTFVDFDHGINNAIKRPRDA